MAKYLLLKHYAPIEGVPPINQWEPDDFTAHIEFMHQINDELAGTGELVEAQGLTGPDQAKIVTFGGYGSPVITDGPFPESKEFLAGYWMVDVESEERALEIAAKASAAPGPGGRPIKEPIEVRAVGVAPE